MRERHVGSAIVLILLGLTASAGAAETMKHSGSIFSIADDGATLVLAEVGPWRVRQGATVITYRTIAITPETRFAIVSRDDQGVPGFRGDFVEMPLGPDGIYLNDFVTIDCLHEGKRLVALKITVTEVLPLIETNIGTRRSSAAWTSPGAWHDLH